jgi:hypothetical protein
MQGGNVDAMLLNDCGVESLRPVEQNKFYTDLRWFGRWS